MTYMADWQIDQLGCTCQIHRYDVAHICECGKLISHSQADWDAHRFHGEMLGFDSADWKHGWTARDMFDSLNASGALPYGAHIFEVLYEKLGESQ